MVISLRCERMDTWGILVVEYELDLDRILSYSQVQIQIFEPSYCGLGSKKAFLSCGQI